MVLISQEKFNEAVRENIEDLEMSPEEAVEEAVKEFEAQGANLDNIIKEVMSNTSIYEILDNAVQNLIALNKSNATPEKFCEQLLLIKTECDKGIEYKVHAGKSAYAAILDVIQKHKSDITVVKNCFRTLISLMSKQPDLLDDRGIQIINEFLNKHAEFESKKLALKLSRECCLLHEKNRQNLFESNIIENLKELLQEGSSDILKEVLAVCRALVLDDDVRVEFGRAHEHARVIASETLCSITGLLNRFQTDDALIHDLLLTLATLLVRAEFCKKVEDVGGIKLIYDVMNTFSQHEKINKQCFKLLKALAGNDDCKAHIIQKFLAPVICTNLNIHKDKVITAAAGLSCVAALCLRCPENSKAFFDAGIADVIVETMRTHPDDKNVQKAASWAIRNMVSRSRYQNTKFLQLGVEEILQADLKNLKEIEYDIKAALRDLGCNVQLKEEWTGKGGMITTASTQDI